MLAEREKMNVFDGDDLSAIGVEQRVVDDLVKVLVITGRQLTPASGDSFRSSQQSLTARIFADLVDERVNEAFEPIGRFR